MTTIEDYRVEEKLAEAEFGQVFRGFDVETDEEVLLKRLPMETMIQRIPKDLIQELRKLRQIQEEELWAPEFIESPSYRFFSHDSTKTAPSLIIATPFEPNDIPFALKSLDSALLAWMPLSDRDFAFALGFFEDEHGKISTKRLFEMNERLSGAFIERDEFEDVGKPRRRRVRMKALTDTGAVARGPHKKKKKEDEGARRVLAHDFSSFLRTNLNKSEPAPRPAPKEVENEPDSPRRVCKEQEEKEKREQEMAEKRERVQRIRRTSSGIARAMPEEPEELKAKRLAALERIKKHDERLMRKKTEFEREQQLLIEKEKQMYEQEKRERVERVKRGPVKPAFEGLPPSKLDEARMKIEDRRKSERDLMAVRAKERLRQAEEEKVRAEKEQLEEEAERQRRAEQMKKRLSAKYQIKETSFMRPTSSSKIADITKQEEHKLRKKQSEQAHSSFAVKPDAPQLIQAHPEGRELVSFEDRKKERMRKAEEVRVEKTERRAQLAQRRLSKHAERLSKIKEQEKAVEEAKERERLKWEERVNSALDRKRQQDEKKLKRISEKGQRHQLRRRLSMERRQLAEEQKIAEYVAQMKETEERLELSQEKKEELVVTRAERARRQVERELEEQRKRKEKLELEHQERIAALQEVHEGVFGKQEEEWL